MRGQHRPRPIKRWPATFNRGEAVEVEVWVNGKAEWRRGTVVQTFIDGVQVGGVFTFPKTFYRRASLRRVEP